MIAPISNLVASFLPTATLFINLWCFNEGVMLSYELSGEVYILSDHFADTKLDIVYTNIMIIRPAFEFMIQAMKSN